MTNTVEFKIAIIRAGLQMRDVAKQLGISQTALYNKSNNVTEFKASELASLYNLLNLSTLEDRQRIFFASNVD